MRRLEATAYLEEILLESHEFHRRKGLKGCDPRLYWQFPGYKYSSRNGGSFGSLVRRLEVLSYTVFPPLVRFYKAIYRIEDVVSDYGLALFVQCYVRMASLYRTGEYIEIASNYGDLLMSHLVSTPSGKLGISSPGEGIAGVNLPGSSEAIYAFVDLYRATNDEKYRGAAHSIALSIQRDFYPKIVGDKALCLDYSIAGDRRYVINANALAAGALAQVAGICDDRRFDSMIEAMARYVRPYLHRQIIPYSGDEDCRSSKGGDVYHTGFTLRGMADAIGRINIVERVAYMREIFQGVRYARASYLNRQGLVNTYIDRPIIDIHGTAEFIRTVGTLGMTEVDWWVVVRNVRHMFKRGTYYYRRGLVPAHRYLPRWGHAPMMLAIAQVLMSARDGKRGPSLTGDVLLQ